MVSKIIIAGLVAIAFVAGSIMIGSMAYGQVTLPNEASLIVYSNSEWSGYYGREGSSNSVSGQDVQTFKFSCNQNDSYVADFTKEIEDGYLILNIIQNGELLNFGSTETEYGHISISGKCQTSQVPSNNNGFISISTDKNAYQYGETIRIDGTAKFISRTSQLKFEIFDPNMKHIWTDSFSLVADNVFAKFPQIKGTLWQTDGQYTVVVSYDKINKVTQKINITQTKTTETPVPTQQPTPQPPTPKQSTKIPDWIKNTMQWYLDGSISENEMISAIQFLVKEGIIKLN